MSAELAAAHVSLFAETSHLARDAAQAIDRIGSDMERTLTRAFSAAGGSITRGGLGTGLSQSMQTAGQAAGQAGGRAAAQGFSAQLNRIDATAFNRIARGAEGASEEIQRLNRWQLNDLIREANRAGQQIGQPLEAGASAAQRALRRLDAEGLENLIRSATQARSAIGRVGDEAAQATRSAGGAARAAGEESGQQAAAGMGDKLADLLGGKAGIIGSTVAAAFSLAGFSAGGLFIKALQNGMEQERVLDLNQARLGVDDQTMQKIGFAAGRAFAGNFGESVESNIDTARRAINSGLLDRSGTAQETQQIIQQLTSVSDLMGEEIPAVARAAGQAVKTGIAGSATDAFDLFTAAEQNGLNVSEDFLDTITEYGTQFRKLGLSGPEAVGLINQAVLAGARDTDVAADAIKEFSIRVVDGSDSTKEAFETLGFGADDMTKKFAQGGSVARAAVGDLLGKIREIQDPVEKNQVALALFGTQFEDLGDALNQFNLDDAAASLGKVAGAADQAISTMGENSAGSIESAKRSIQISTDQISAALASAFGPELAKVADWVTKHQPEILGFLGNVVDFAFKGADAFLAFSSGSLRALANFAEGAAPLLAMVLDPVGKVAEVFGKLTRNSDLENLGKSVQGLDDKFRGVADGARAIADGIDNSLRPHLQGLQESVSQNIETTRLAQEVFRALGQEVTAIPSEHDIVLKDNTPETTANLQALGLTVTTLPNGEVHVTADTADGQAKLDAFIQSNTGRVLPLQGYVSFNQSIPVETLSKIHDIPPGYARGGTIPKLASGGLAGRTLEGLLWGPGSGTSDNILGIGPNGIPTALVSPGEGVVMADAMARGGAELVAALNRGWVPPVDFLNNMVRGGARLWHGQYDGSLRGLGIEEDNPLVAAAIGIRELLVKGNYDGTNLRTFGIEEDNPLVDAALGLRSLAHGDYDSRLRKFGIEEDNPLVSAGIGAGALLMRGDYNPNLRQFGIEEDNPLVDAGIGLGGLMRGDYTSNLRTFGLEEDNPLVSAILGTRQFLADLPGFAGGGVVPGKAFAQRMDPARYLLGGFSESAIDCSGMVSATINDALGLPAFSSRMSTASEGAWLAAKGALPGLGGPGDISVGWMNGGAGGGHTALTLGDGTNVESNGTEGVVIGGPVGAADKMFTDKMHIPAALLRGGDLGGGSTGGGASGFGGLGSGGLGAGGASGAGGAAGGGTFNGGSIPAGVTPVLIVGSSTAQAGAQSGTSATPSESFAPQASAPSDVQTVDQVMAGMPGRAAEAGQNFLNANIDQFLGDIGLRRSGGAVQALVQAVFDAMADAAAAEVKKANARQTTSIMQFGGR